MQKSQILSGSNTEKIWVHQFSVKQKTDVPKAHKIAARGLGSAVSPTEEVRKQSP